MKNPPKLKQKLEVKKYHGIEIKDEYSWIHQKNILEVLRDSSKLLPDVRKYLEDENKYTEHNLKETNEFQKKLFDYKSKNPLFNDLLTIQIKEPSILLVGAEKVVFSVVK